MLEPDEALATIMWGGANGVTLSGADYFDGGIYVYYILALDVNGDGSYTPDAWVLDSDGQPFAYNTSTSSPNPPISGWISLSGSGCSNGTLLSLGGTAYPVEWLNISAKQIQTAVSVNWSTASELNSSHFTLQRATDGETFSDLATLPSHGNSTVAHSYELTDNSPLAGRNLYRVQETGIDGAVSHSATVEVSYASVVSVGTNGNSLVIRGAAAGDRFFLYDMAGRLVRDLSLTSANQTVSVSESGIYCWRLRGNNTSPFTGKVLLQN